MDEFVTLDNDSASDIFPQIISIDFLPWLLDVLFHKKSKSCHSIPD